MTDEELNRYSRHILLDEIGIEGQTALAAAQVVVIGAGGLGCVVAHYLVAAGVGQLRIADDDTIDLTNLQRQILYATDHIGHAKPTAAQKRLRQINPLCEVEAITTRATADNIDSVITNATMVVDASDNFATRHLVNRASNRLRRPLSFGAAVGFDGQATTFDFATNATPCYNCIFCEQDEAADVRCATMGVFSPVVGLVGCVQASEVLKYIAMPAAAESLIGRLLLIDAKAMRFRSVQVHGDPACTVCAASQ